MPSRQTNRNIFIALTLVMLVLGILVSAAFPLIFGFILLYLLWAETGGMSYGNPYKKKMLQEGKSALTQAAAASLDASGKKVEAKHDNSYFLIALLGLGSVGWGILIILLM